MQSTTQFGSLIAKNKENFVYLNKVDQRMRFNNSEDPIYYAFDCLDNRPLTSLAKEFVTDSIYELTKFISGVITK